VVVGSVDGQSSSVADDFEKTKNRRTVRQPFALQLPAFRVEQFRGERRP